MSTSGVGVPVLKFISPVRLMSYEVLDMEDRFCFFLRVKGTGHRAKGRSGRKIDIIINFYARPN